MQQLRAPPHQTRAWRLPVVDRRKPSDIQHRWDAQHRCNQPLALRQAGEKLARNRQETTSGRRALPALRYQPALDILPACLHPLELAALAALRTHSTALLAPIALHLPWLKAASPVPHIAPHSACTGRLVADGRAQAPPHDSNHTPSFRACAAPALQNASACRCGQM
jgi:hypothetical protein